MKKTVLIMAGGRGERFWPKSRKDYPKQFLSLTDDNRSMIQLTVDRISSLVELEDIFVVTNKEYVKIVQQQLPDIPIENILCEPMGRNTAPCIGLGAVYIQKKYDDAIMIVLPSDQLIKFNNMYINVLKEACNLVDMEDNLITIGITPDYPETEYGYIKFNSEITKNQGYKVEHFVEKPDLSHAKEYIECEEYLWNSGMFIWKVSTIMSNMKCLMPEMFNQLLNIKVAIGTKEENVVIEQEFVTMQSISIDYGIMEKAENIYVIPGAFGWDDVGSWSAVTRIKKSNEYGNIVDGDVITINTWNSVIQGNNRLIATVGIRDTIIVDTNDAILICDKDNTSDIKKVLENLRICNRNVLL